MLLDQANGFNDFELVRTGSLEKQIVPVDHGEIVQFAKRKRRGRQSFAGCGEQRIQSVEIVYSLVLNVELREQGLEKFLASLLRMKTQHRLRDVTQMNDFFVFGGLDEQDLCLANWPVAHTLRVPREESDDKSS